MHQRNMNGMNVLIHVAGAANFGYALYYDLMFVHVPPHMISKGQFSSMTAFPGKWKYLTIWNMVLQLVYHSIALLNDFVGTSELNSKRQSYLQKFRDYLFASWVFPAGTFVSLSFWILYGIDRALVFPKEMDEFFPNWLNHAVHTVPIILLMIESHFVCKIFPSSFSAIIGNLFFTGTYISWICYVNHISNVWAYPILDVLNLYQRAGFMAGCAVAILACFFVGEALNNWRWGKRLHEGKGTSAKGSKSAKGKRKIK